MEGEGGRGELGLLRGSVGAREAPRLLLCFSLGAVWGSGGRGPDVWHQLVK